VDELTYTDDTEMMIGVAESLIENKGFDFVHLAETFLKNYDPSRGYGPGPPYVFRLVSSGIGWREASKLLFGGSGSYGNGAAMRIAPIGLSYRDPATLRRISYESAEITHFHPYGKEGAFLQAYSVSLALHGVKGEEFVEKLEKSTRFSIYRKKIGLMKELLKKKSTSKEVARKLGNGIEAFNSIPSAIYSFLSTSSFKHAIIFAVSLGGDTDTIGAMTGAISGAYYGAGEIPEEWKEKLERREYIEMLAEKLWKIFS
jgi:poly(ADP-ribose) glycohydrolase ARH3